MIRDIEFYFYGADLWFIKDGENRKLTDKDKDVVEKIIDIIKKCYPKAYSALAKEYRKSRINVPYHKFLMVRRFCKCNFGTLSTTRKDIGHDGLFNLKVVPCPLRGECGNEGLICMPKAENGLSAAEERVMRLYYEGYEVQEVAEMLYLSYETAKVHKKNAYRKMGVHNRGEFVKYVEKHNLF